METTSEALAVILARLEVKLDSLLSDSSDHEVRLRKLEERRWPLQTLAVVVSILAILITIGGLVVGNHAAP